MCQYSATDGVPNDWHFVHLGSRAVGGAALVMSEATAVADIGRISPGDTGIWNDEQVDAWRRITRFIEQHGAVPAIQLAHAGWKASTAAPWDGGKAVAPEQGGWQPIGVAGDAFAPHYPSPRQASAADIDSICLQFRDATRRAIDAGFKVFEIHAAHGYLLHSFYSPLSNRRTDDFGGSFENRTRLLMQVVRDVRQIIPDHLPVVVRLSCTDWTEGGWTIDDSVRLATQLKQAGVDAIDCSSGGVSRSAKIPVGPGYQVELAAAVRRGAGIATAAVGMITEPHQAETILRTGQADLVFLARELLRDPYWPRRAADALRAKITPPVQYERAW